MYDMEGPMLELLVTDHPCPTEPSSWLDFMRPRRVMSTDDPRFTPRGPLTGADLTPTLAVLPRDESAEGEA